MNFRMIWMGPEDGPGDGSQRSHAIGRRRHPESNSPRFYAQCGDGMVRYQRLPNGVLKITPLTNFHARIVQDAVLDDGERQQREFGIEAALGGATVRFSVSAAEFGRMGWVLSQLGSQAIIYGQHQHARAVIQSLSGAIGQKRISTHSGWRQEGFQWICLHSGGAIGSEGPVSGIEVQMPTALQAYHLAPPGLSALGIIALTG